jgi:hypothetical protein
MKSNYSNENKFSGIYRGFVVYNEDPLNKGRIKIFIPGVYSSKYMDNYDLLPWALPAMSIFGGGSTNKHKTGVLNQEVGWSSVPHMGTAETGSQVFVFFENSDINFPIYFAVSQSGEGWLSEHPDQHVFNSDNVRIRIDESIYNEEKHEWETDEKSTCRHDSYTENIPDLGKKQLEVDCEQNGWSFANGKSEKLETRIDIEIKAENINAVNLNIHGNVNMHIDGNWYIEHIGNKYEYHKGEHYIKHDGSTYIEHNGIYKNVQEGTYSHIHTGNYNNIHTGDAMITRTGKLFEKINGDVSFEFDKQYNITIGGKINQTYNGDYSFNVKGNYSKTITKNKTEEVFGNVETVVFGWIQHTADENISFITKKGNFTVKTEGLFELFDEKNNITSDGFVNLGNRGNIQFISTFGNINLQCIKNDNVANFAKESVVIPWNPGFLAEINKNITMFPTFNKEIATATGFDFPTDITSFGSVASFYTSLPEQLIYDGLPVFLPTKMIVQNPNIPAPMNPDDLSWIPNFRSEVTDWRSGDNTMYWKLPGRMMGNINIETWSGDINIKTDSELGCAGNINIVANERTGTLPGYQIGCVNIKNSAKKRIYPDPRDLFFDSDFMMKMAGQLKLFSHGTNVEDAKSLKNILLPGAASAFVSQLGINISLHAVDYDKFYSVNAMNILTNGFMTDASPETSALIDELKKRPAPKLGCLKCIADFLLGIPGIQDICYTNENLLKFASVGIHRNGFSKFNPFDTKNPRGVFNIDTGSFNKISIGDGHAIDIGFTDRELGGKNIGSFNLISDTDLTLSTGKNYYLSANTTKKDATYEFSHVVVDKALDDFPPKILSEGLKILSPLWPNTGGKAFTITDGVVKILNNVEINTDIKIMNVYPELKYISLGYVNQLTEKIGKNISYLNKDENTYSFDYGFDFEKMKDLISSLDFTKITPGFSKNESITRLYEGACIENRTSKNTANVKINNFNDKMTITMDANKNAFEYSLSDKNNNFSKSYKSDDIFDLSWSLKDSSKKEFLPDWNFRNEYEYNYNLGNSIIDENIILNESYYSYHDNSKEISLAEPVPGSSFVDIYKNYTCNTYDNSSVWKSFLKGPSRDIKETHIEFTKNDIVQDFSYSSDRSTSKDVVYSSPINKNIFTLHSDNIWEDASTKTIYSTNQLETIISGTYTPSQYDSNSEWKREISNNTKIEQKGFSTNNIKVRNGVDDKLNDTKNNIYIDNGSNSTVNTTLTGFVNTFSFKNGGNGQTSTNNFGILNGYKANVSQNSLDIFNGVDGNGTDKVINVNSLSINNGKGSFTKNDFVLNNGHGIGGPCNFTINNCGEPGKSVDTFTLNNNNNETELKMVGSGPESGAINVFSSLSKQDDIKKNYILNVENQTENTKTKTFNNNAAFNIATNAFTTAVATTNTINSDVIVINADTSITQTSPNVVISRIDAKGVMQGDFQGSFQGTFAGQGAIAPGGLSPLGLAQPSPGAKGAVPPVPSVAKIGSGPIVSIIKDTFIKFLKFELSFFEKYF